MAYRSNYLITQFLVLFFCCLFAFDALANGTSFKCKSTEEGTVEHLICNDSDLAELDRKLADVYLIAKQKAVNEHPPVLRAEQRGWIKERNECWKSDDERSCVEQSYLLRIAELQALYRLIPITAKIRYLCEGEPGYEVIAAYFDTEPPTLFAELGDSVSLMYRQPAASGARYRGGNETLWDHHGEATIIWGDGAPEMRCQAHLL